MRRQQLLQMLFERSPPGGRDKRAIDNALDPKTKANFADMMGLGPGLCSEAGPPPAITVCRRSPWTVIAVESACRSGSPTEPRKSYNIPSVTGDRYAGQWCQQAFQKRGIMYVPSEVPKSGLYLDFLPKLNSRTIRLVDNTRLVNQIAALERRTSRGDKDSIDHPPQGHDDLANVVAGVAHCAVNRHSVSVTELRI